MKQIARFLFRPTLSYGTLVIFGLLIVPLWGLNLWLGFVACVLLGALNDIMADLTA